MGKQKPLTEEEAAKRIKAMGREIEEYSQLIGAAAWEKDAHLKALKKTYLKLAKVETQ